MDTKNKKGKEVYKYDKIYSHEGLFSKSGFSSTWDGANDFLKSKWNQYGHSVEGGEYTKDVLKLNPKSIIDIGCGWNEFCQIMKNHGVSDSVGLDCSCPGADITASAHDIPIDDKSYDLLTSFDCIEHIPEEEIPLCFKEFSRVSNRMFIKICLVDTATRIDNEGLHSCVMPPAWWLKQVEVYFNIIGTLTKIGESWGTQYIIIYGESKIMKTTLQKIEYEGDSYEIYTLNSDERSTGISKTKGTQKSKVALWRQIVDLNPELVLDIGANYGEFSVTIADRHKNILSFEPNTEVFDCLQSSINELNNPSIKCFNVAIGDKDLTSTLYIPKTSGNASLDLNSVHDKNKVEYQTVEEKNILNYITGYKSFVAKIDIEGTEYKILNKIKENEHLFDWYCVFFEFNKGTDLNKNKIDIISNFLNEKNIKIVHKDDSKILNEEVFKYRGEDFTSKPVTDIVAFYNI